MFLKADNIFQEYKSSTRKSFKVIAITWFVLCQQSWNFLGTLKATLEGSWQIPRKRQEGHRTLRMNKSVASALTLIVFNCKHSPPLPTVLVFEL